MFRKGSILLFVMAFLFSGCAQMQDKNESTEIANPWVTISSISDISNVVGFDLDVPEKIQDSTISTITVSESLQIANVDYALDDAEVYAFIRKGPKDVVSHGVEFSGIYMEFEETEEDSGLTIYSNDGKAFLVEWDKDDFHYCIYAQNGMNKEEIKEIISEIE